ncbi:hypothetical protein HDA40_002940 [Hamadaea flava]|nr:hypothetical protein [Hamadaea flava]
MIHIPKSVAVGSGSDTERDVDHDPPPCYGSGKSGVDARRKSGYGSGKSGVDVRRKSGYGSGKSGALRFRFG